MPPVRIPVHVTSRAARDEICGWRQGELAVRVTAPPDEGRANTVVCRVVAKALGVPKSAVSVVRGPASRHKRLEIEGVGEERIAEVFGSVQR